VPSNDASKYLDSALSRALYEALTRPITEEELAAARRQLAEEAKQPKGPQPTGSVISVTPRMDPPTEV